MKNLKIPGLLFAAILPFVHAAAADSHALNSHSEKIAPTSGADFIDHINLTQTMAAVPAPEPSSLALILAGALAFIGLSILRHRSQL